MMSHSKKFATSLVSLALVRNGYSTSTEFKYVGNLCADILAVGEHQGAQPETFIVEIMAVRDRASIPEPLEVFRQKYSTLFGVTVYLAFFVDSDDLLIVDDELRKRMRFNDAEVRLEVIPPEYQLQASRL
jgi:hypothetical protein